MSNPWPLRGPYPVSSTPSHFQPRCDWILRNLVGSNRKSFPKQCLHWGVLAVLLKKGLWFVRGSVFARVRSQTSVFIGFGEGHSRLVQAKWSLFSFSIVKHICFNNFYFKIGLGRWVPRMPPRCLPDASQMPGCLDAWMPGCPIQSKIHNPKIDDLLVQKYLTSLFWIF